MSRALVGLGSNLGDRAANLSAAVTALGAISGVTVQATSSWRQTLPVGGPPGQSPYLNAAAVLETSLAPEALLDEFQSIELALGRRREAHWGPRTIDLDLLLYDDRIIDTPRLIVPHPWLAVRRFVLAPAVELAADWPHPALGWTLGRLLAHLNNAPNYLALCGAPGVGKTRVAEQLTADRGDRLLRNPTVEGEAAAAAQDPAGQAWTTEIEFLAERQRLLAADKWGQARGWTVSDFWFGQSLAYAALQLAPDDLAGYRELWEPAATTVVAPKLLVLLESHQDATPGQDRLREKLVELIERPAWGPVLHLRQAEPAAIVSQLGAAIDAMQ